MKPKKIVGFAFGPICAGLIGFVTLPLIAWFSHADDVGRMAIFYLTINLVVMLFGLGLDQAYVREYHDSSDKTHLLMQVLLPGLALLFLFVCVIAFLGVERFSYVIFSVESVELGVLVLLCAVISYLSRFLFLILRMEERGKEFSAMQIMAKLMFLLVFSGYIFFGVDVSINVLVKASALSIAMVFFSLLFFVWPSFRGGFKKKVVFAQVKGLLRYSLPLALSGLAFWGLSASDRMFLKAISTYKELAIYSVSMSFAAVGITLQSIFSTVWAPTVYRWLNEGRDMAIVGEVSRYIMIVVLLVFSLVGALSWIVDFFLPPLYGGVGFIVVACLGFPLYYTLSETTFVGIAVTKKTKFAVYASIIALTINATGNFLLVPRFGAAGAAVSTCFSFWVFLVLRTEFSIWVFGGGARGEIYFFTFLCFLLACAMALCGDDYGYFFNLAWAAVFFFTLAKFKREFSLMLKWAFQER